MFNNLEFNMCVFLFCACGTSINEVFNFIASFLNNLVVNLF